VGVIAWSPLNGWQDQTNVSSSGQLIGEYRLQNHDLDFGEFRTALAAQRYLLVATVPWYQDANGEVWLDDMWHRDLLAHLDYISNLIVLAPRRTLPVPRPETLLPVSEVPSLDFLDFPCPESTARAVLKSPMLFAAAWRAVRQADIVQSGAAGWPLPPGLFVNPVAALLQRPLVIVIESAFWRLTGPGPHSLLRRLRAKVSEALARWSIRHAHLSVLTHAGYRDTLAQKTRGDVMVIPASWIDAETVVSEKAAQTTRTGPGRLLLAARLTAEKGISSVLEALERADPGVSLTIIGEGPLRSMVAQASERLGRERLRLLDPVPYGPEFFALIREHDAVLVPTLSDEQPRILYDAFSQGRPALASDTPGNREAAREGETAWLFAPGDVGALTQLLNRAGVDAQALRAMQPAARDLALQHTHQHMHYLRAKKLAALFGKGSEEETRHGPAQT